MTEDIRNVLKTHAHLRVDAETISPNADLFAAGMTSHASIGVMLALEEEFDIEFPDDMLKRSTFESISSIESAVGGIKEQVAI
jgi:acyl carrier protein